jgi:diguanylate cyclase (GGDEF)-like protein
MRKATRQPRPELTGIAALLTLLALVAGDEYNEDIQRARIEQIRISWPIVTFGQGFALIMLFGGLAITHNWPAMAMLAVPATATVALIGGQSALLMRPSLARLPSHVQVRLLSPLCTALGGAGAMLLDGAARNASGIAHDAGLFGLALACAMAALAIAPLPLALLGYGVALAVGCALGAGSAAAGVATLAMAPAVLTLFWRIATVDLRKRRQALRRESDRVLATRLVREFEAQGSGWFWETDRDGMLTYLSRSVAGAAAPADREAIGCHLTEIFQLDSAAPDTERTLNFHLSSRTSFADYTVQAVNGRSERWWSMSGRPLIDEIGQFRGFIGNGGDLTEKRRANAEISRLALFDGLTGLANRQRMRLSLEQALAQQRNAYSPTSLFLLDLDRFKAVNDTMGHQTGDALLKLVGQRLLRAIGEAGLVGRVGGDEFQVIVPGEANRDRLGALADTVIASLSAPYTIDGGSIAIGCSIGIAIAPEDGRESETLIRNADLALYSAKADGRGIHRFYHEQLLTDARNRRQLEDDLRDALSRGEFHVAYQPVVSTKDERIIGYEALLRWRHPVHGWVSPADFIPIAEECGLIEKIGEWVLRTACATAATWPRNVRVAVNVSPIQFANPQLPALVTSALAQSGIAPDRLELEITEGVFLANGTSTDQMFARLKAIGVRLALDDFGTGYSSLGYLKQAPFDKIKIDQSFVRGAAIGGNRNAAIIKAIVALAETLGMETTAEGVEVQDEIALIRELGCSHIQGYVYGKGIFAEDVLIQLGAAGGQARPTGFRISREARTAMLRTAVLAVGPIRHMVRIRNIGSGGAMIDGVDLVPGTELRIEIIPGETVPAHVRWARDGKAGLKFEEPIALARLAAATMPQQTRRVA